MLEAVSDVDASTSPAVLLNTPSADLGLASNNQTESIENGDMAAASVVESRPALGHDLPPSPLATLVSTHPLRDRRGSGDDSRSVEGFSSKNDVRRCSLAPRPSVV
jgi:hypothetical protein